MPIPILVADSNREFGILIRQALEESGRFEVSLASSADEAVSLARDLDFRLAIIDFALPDIEGEKIVQRLRALQPGLAVIGIPVDDGDSSDKTREAGVDGILTKPFYLPNLPDIVEEALGRRLDFHRPPQPSWPRKTAPEAEVTSPVEPPSEPASPGEEDVPLSFDTPPPWLTDVDRAAQYLARLTLETSAAAALLVRHRELIAFAGQLPRSQLQELTAQVADSWAEEGRSGAVARFVHLPGTAEDFMLYATGVVAEIVLSLVFSAEVPFGMIRRQAESLAHTLSQVDPAQHSTETGGDAPDPIGPKSLSPQLGKPETSGSKTPSHEFTSSEADISTSHGQMVGETALPEDWIPRPSQLSPSAKLLDELESLQLPEPDPEESIPKASPAGIQTPQPQTPALPLDWLPMITHSQRHLPFLADPEPEETAACASKPAASEPGSTSSVETEHGAAPTIEVGTYIAPPNETGGAGVPASESVEAPQVPPPIVSGPAPLPPPVEASDPRLRYTVVFAPRFPEHRLAGPLVDNLSQWTTRLCLAWDWKAERVHVSEDALLVQIMLPPDVAPATAAQELSKHLSARIFETFPHLEPGFSTGGFWASAHMLVSGKTVTQSEVDSFVTNLRLAQGLGD